MKASLPFKYIQAVKNGIHQVVFDFKDDNGKRKRKWVSTGLSEKCSKKELKCKVDEIAANFSADFYSGKATKVKSDKVDKSKISESILKNSVNGESGEYGFIDFMEYWLETTKPMVANSTYLAYLSSIKKIRGYFNEKYPNVLLSDVTGLMIQQFYNDMYNSGLTANTIRHFHSNIHAAFKYAVKMDLLNASPSDKTELPKMNKFAATFYDVDELNKLFEVFKDDRMELVVYIAAYYGLRRSEVCGLKWDAIDFKNKTISIRRKVVNEYVDGKEKIICRDELKTVSSKRTLPLIPQIEKMLRERKELEEMYSRLLKDDYDKEFDGFVCRDNFGKLITPNYVTSHFKYIIARKKLKHLRFHDLRHSCASLLLANGVSMKAIQEWLGHSTFNITANIYAHLDCKSKITSAETISRAFSKDSSNLNKDDENEADKKVQQ